MEYITREEKIKLCGEYDVIVAGGGVSGVAAALAARRHGVERVLVIEKTVNIGGLATTGLINFFVPMCNGRGRQIIFGMAEEFLRESIKYGFDSLAGPWKNGGIPTEPTKYAYATQYSPWIFSLRLTEMLKEEGVDIFLDTVISDAVVENGHVDGLILQSKSGREYYKAKYVIDATGDSEVFDKAGAPCVTGENYFTYAAKKITLDSCRRACEFGDIKYAYATAQGGYANLYGGGQPKDRPLYSGVTKEEITEYIVENEMVLLEKCKKDDRKSRDLAWIPFMPQFRTIRHIKGDYSLKMEDAYKHFDDSVCVINDFDHKDRLFEVPLGTMIDSDFDNIIAVGRCASAEGFAWDVLRVIPPAILTGQAAGTVCSECIKDMRAVKDTDIHKVQKLLEGDNVAVHFDDELVPADKENVEKMAIYEYEHI